MLRKCFFASRRDGYPFQGLRLAVFMLPHCARPDALRLHGPEQGKERHGRPFGHVPVSIVPVMLFQIRIQDVVYSIA